MRPTGDPSKTSGDRREPRRSDTGYSERAVLLHQLAAGDRADTPADLDRDRVAAGVTHHGELVAGGGWNTRGDEGAWAEARRGALPELLATAAEVVDARVVDDGDVLTAGGVTSGLDLAVYLVEREWGEDVAQRVTRELECERRGSVSHGPSGEQRS